MWVGGHAQVGWFAARAAGLGPRDRALVALASMLPDLDAIGIVFGVSAYFSTHHVWLHNVFACGACSLGVALWAERRALVAICAAIGVVLHLVSDGFGLLALAPLWPVSSRVFWPNDGRYWVAAISEMGVPVALIAAQVWLFRRDGTSILEILPQRAKDWLARRWRQHLEYRQRRR